VSRQKGRGLEKNGVLQKSGVTDNKSEGDVTFKGGSGTSYWLPWKAHGRDEHLSIPTWGEKRGQITVRRPEEKSSARGDPTSQDCQKAHAHVTYF